MKRNMMLGFFALTLMACFAFAGNGTEMNVTIPFDFYAGSQLIPAGEYKFEMGALNHGSASSVIMRTKDGSGVSVLVTMPDVNRSTFQNHLRFNQYGAKYFLSSIAISSHKANLKPTKLEQELRSQLDNRDTILVAER
jgi:hypothetical protein